MLENMPIIRKFDNSRQIMLTTMLYCNQDGQFWYF